MVCLLYSAMNEAAVQVFSAIVHSGFRYIWNRIIINTLAPTDIPKEGAAYELPMALGILGASVRYLVYGMEFLVIMGKLCLDGRLMRI